MFSKKQSNRTVVGRGIGIVLGLIFFVFFLPKASANMSSNSFIIQFNNLNMTSGSKTSSSYKVTDTVGQNAPGKYGTTGYIVKAGFQYIYTIGNFSFSISNTMINFGLLTPNTFATGTTTLTVSAKGAGGYTVTTYENYPLKKIGTSATIADTTCNAGTCTEGTAGVWTDATKPGFGYNMTGSDIPAAFVDATYFKQFANYSQNEPPQTIMSNAGVVKNRQATVTYKVAVSGNQTAGNYENNITYIATPGY
ncbi:MAG: hypothetical protein HZA34_00800 [Candidatus Pacebacteria bacterium]|nr:hypothetical protein [Candidatus Paceibacterota bacterium]